MNIDTTNNTNNTNNPMENTLLSSEINQELCAFCLDNVNITNKKIKFCNNCNTNIIPEHVECYNFRKSQSNPAICLVCRENLSDSDTSMVRSVESIESSDSTQSFEDIYVRKVILFCNLCMLSFGLLIILLIVFLELKFYF